MNRFYKYVLAIMISLSLFNNPKVLAWWNLIFPVEYESCREEDKEIKFFFIEWFKSIRSCKIR